MATYVNDYELPESEPAEEFGEGLYDSRRTYMEQLGMYKAFQGRLDVTKAETA